MDTGSVDVYIVLDLFLLLLIGIGPKIALVPFLELTAGMDAATKSRVARKMITTAAVVGLLLILVGEILRKLLHFSHRGALDRRRHRASGDRARHDPWARGCRGGASRPRRPRTRWSWRSSPWRFPTC